MKWVRAAGVVAVLLALAGVALVAGILNTEGGRLFWKNRNELADGVAEAKLLRRPDGVAALMVQRPELVSLAAWDLGQADAGVFFDADRVRPIASVSKILVASALAHAFETGVLKPEQTMLVDRVERMHLEGTDGSSHAVAMGSLGARPAALSLETLGQLTVEFGDTAATDTLLLLLGRAAIDAEVQRLGIDGLFAPGPFTGDLVMLLEDGVGGSAPDPDRSWALAQRLSTDELWAAKLRQRLLDSGVPTLKEQRAHRKASSQRGTARGYARLMERVGTEQTAWGASMRRWLSWPMPRHLEHERWAQFGTKGGAASSVIASANWAQPQDGGTAVLALFFEDLPTRAWIELWQNYEHEQLEARLLADPGYRAQLGARLAHAQQGAR